MKYIFTYAKIIIVILIIVAIILGVVHVIKNQYTNEEFETLKTDMLLIKGKIKIVSEKVNMKEENAKYIGKELSSVDNNEIQLLVEKEIIKPEDKEHSYYLIDLEGLEELGLNDVKLEKGFYIVDYKNNDVIYSTGIKDKEGNILYKLEDIKSKR